MRRIRGLRDVLDRNHAPDSLLALGRPDHLMLCDRAGARNQNSIREVIRLVASKRGAEYPFQIGIQRPKFGSANLGGMFPDLLFAL